jgi:hypothetical protein
MLNPSHVAAAVLAAITLMLAHPAAAIDGEVLITHAKALAGNVTPGDSPGYAITISRSGSYKLASNLEVTGNRNGIVVTATEVTIDLNGFRMNGGKAAQFGIIGNQRGLTVRNGTILFFKNDGIRMAGALLIVENMRIQENGGSGVNESGTNATFARIVDSTIFGNTVYGIFGGGLVHAEGNLIASNKYRGVRLESGLLLGNTITGNGSYGLWDNGDADTGLANNIFINNNPGGTNQIAGGVVLQPNACTGLPC